VSHYSFWSCFMLFGIENEETQQRDLSWMLQVRPTQDVQHYFLANINYPFFGFSTWVWPVSAMSMISIRHTLVPRSAEKPHFRWQTTHLRLSHLCFSLLLGFLHFSVFSFFLVSSVFRFSHFYASHRSGHDAQISCLGWGGPIALTELHTGW